MARSVAISPEHVQRAHAALAATGRDYDEASVQRIAGLYASEAHVEAQHAFHKAKAAHPLAKTLEGVSDASMRRSEAPQIRFISRDFGNGHKEAVVMRVIPDLPATLDRAIERDLRAVAPRGEGDREASMEASERRSKRQVRLTCKTMQVNSLWTLTFRENVVDREVAWKCLDRFRRKVAAWLPGWKYVAVLERQERGAWHIHLATHALPRAFTDKGVKLKSWDLMRRLWRSVAGDLGGNFDEAKRKGRWGNSKAIKGAGAIASYIAGYVAKDMRESPLNRKRYSVTKGVEIPEPYRALFAGDTHMAELVELAYAAVGENITRAWFDADRGIFYVESDDTKTGPH